MEIINTPHDYSMSTVALGRKLIAIKRKLFNLQEQGYSIECNLNGETGKDNWKQFVVGMDEIFVDVNYRAK